MHIHYDFRIDLDEIVDIFAELHPRKMQLSSAACWKKQHDVFTENKVFFVRFLLMYVLKSTNTVEIQL